MTDDADGNDPVYPWPGMPTVFTDGVLNLSRTTEVVKFYLGRFDPTVRGVGADTQREIVQVVMPMSGFVGTAIFFERMLQKYIEDKVVSRSDVDDMRRSINADAPEDGSA